MEKTTLVFVDHHDLFRALFTFYLKSVDSLTVLADVRTADDAIRVAGERSPDVVVIHAHGSAATWLETVQRIREAVPRLRLLVLSPLASGLYNDGALRARVFGYRGGDASLRVLVAEIEGAGAVDSEFPQDTCLCRRAGSGYQRVQNGAEMAISNLTRRETEVLRHVAEGLAKKEIARVMGLSIKTVDKHVENLMRKLDIHDRVELTRFAIREGLAEP